MRVFFLFLNTGIEMEKYVMKKKLMHPFTWMMQ